MATTTTSCGNTYKVCKVCYQILLATKENFPTQKTARGTVILKAKCHKCNREYHKKYNERYFEQHKGEILKHNEEYNKGYYKTIQGKLIVLNSNSRKRFKENYIHNMTLEMYEEMMNFFDNRCAYSGMEFDNNFSFEHIDCYSYKGIHAIWNIIPCISNINTSKGEKDFLTWYTSSEYYSKERLDKIEAWQLYSFNKWKNKRGQ